MPHNHDNQPKPESIDEADQAAVTVNEDGSITIAQSGEVAKAPPAQQWTGIDLKPDARFGSMLASKFINCLMYDGKKATAECVFYAAMDQIADKMKADPLPIFEQALENVKPLVEVRSKRIGGANYQVPVEPADPRHPLDPRSRAHPQGPPDRREARPGTGRLLQQDRLDHPEA